MHTSICLRACAVVHQHGWPFWLLLSLFCVLVLCVVVLTAEHVIRGGGS